MNDNYSSENWNKDKESLIYSITLLLKLNWDKSKREIMGAEATKYINFIIGTIEVFTLISSYNIILNMICNLRSNNFSFENGVTILLLGLIVCTPFILKWIVPYLESSWSNIILYVVLLIGPFFIYLYFVNNQINISLGYFFVLVILYLILWVFLSEKFGTDIGKMVAYFEQKIGAKDLENATPEEKDNKEKSQ